jgi:fumarate reductase flavoprotein subunit
MPQRHSSGDFDTEVDVLIVGAGGAGLVAALAAHEAGATVAVLEKSGRAGGNTALSTGSVPGAGTRYQAAAGIEDSPERLAEDLLRQSGAHDAEWLVHRLAAESASLVEWLRDGIGIELELITDYRHVGHSVPRLHAPRSRRGQDLVNDLVRAVGEREIPLALGNPVEDLLLDDAGGVCGVLVRGERTTETRLGARGVVLAANGFAANREMLREHCPDIAEAEYFGSHGSTGEAIRWARELGARLENMGAYQGYAAVAYPHGSITSWTTVEMGGVLVNPDGRRFGDESIGYSGFTADVLAHGGRAWVLFDERIRDYTAGNEDEFRELVELGGVHTAETPDELAACFGLPAQTLSATVSEAQRDAAADVPDRFGRRDFGFGPLTAPFAMCRTTPGLFHTQGGTAVDGDGRVVGADGVAIAGLFAAGGVAVGISGRSGGRGYSSGNGLLTAMGLGRLAGRAAAGPAPAR